MTRFVTRFAPSPTGHLHLGHAASAFHVWEAATLAGGTVLLRIEDIDQTRCRPDFEASILADLAWLGFDWPKPVRRQSDHFDAYAKVINALAARGLVYRCFLTRAEILARLPAGTSPDEAGFRSEPPAPSEESKRLQSGAPFAWRLSLAAAQRALGRRFGELSYPVWSEGGGIRYVPAAPEPFGDVVLARKETPASYHLACCHDDALQAITHVVRGEDLRGVTVVHALLQALMDWPQPVYRFHPLILGPDGRKLSKRLGSKGLRDLRAEGMTPHDIRAMTCTA